MKNVLVIGGSLFTGRVFSILASRNGGFNLHVVNRGNHPMDLDRVSQYKCDRSDTCRISNLIPDITYDALIDFCAYKRGDIAPLVAALGGRVKQYIFFSTASVYAPGHGFLDEGAPLFDTTDTNNDAAVEYVYNKICLERELKEACEKAGVKNTILRPTFIYGPFNYAPRESYFIELIAKKRTVPVPADASSRFNFIYVHDIANALFCCTGDRRAYNETFNLAGSEAVTYPLLMKEFEQCNGDAFDTLSVTVARIDKEGIPLPFPLTGDTLIDGAKFSKTYDFDYTPFSEGLEKTFRIFSALYTS